MKEHDLAVYWAVFYEMMGVWLWILLAIAIVAIGAFVTVLQLEKRLHARRFVYAQTLGILLGGPLALIIMAKVSSSGFTDAAGPIDWILIVLVYFLGYVGMTIIAYALMGWQYINAQKPQTA